MNFEEKDIVLLKKLVLLKKQMELLKELKKTDSEENRSYQQLNTKNPFPDPKDLDQDLNEEIIEKMKDLISRKELSLYTFFDNIEESLQNKEIEKAGIWSYYCYNILGKCSPDERAKYLEDILYLFRIVLAPHEEETQ